MLQKLSVKKFAIIDDISIDFNDNMTVLTGETGAGKSLIIDTISLLLGARADSDMIRYGCDKAEITGVFSHNNELNDLFNNYSINIFETITIERIITETKNTIKINKQSVSLNTLKAVASFLADIHVQNDTYKLFSPDAYLSFVDPKDDNTFDKYLSEYVISLSKYNEAYKYFDNIKKGEAKAKEKLEFITYEYDELTKMNLYKGIDTELEERIAKLENYDKIFNSLSSSYNALNGDYTVDDLLYEASKEMKKIGEYDPKYEEYASKLLDVYYIESEIKDDIARELKNMDYDEDELNSLVEELEAINHIKSKYKKNVDELLEYIVELKMEIDITTNYDEALENASNNVKKTYEQLSIKALKLSEYRKKLAKSIEKGIIAECKDLDLDDTRFEIVFNDIKLNDPFDKSIFTETGIDIVSFMISFNKGEPLHSLHKVASGGEMSRIMLAFKSYFSHSMKASLLIFDEIDTGVSGITAKKIADKMHKISENKQIICITHLPQVAAIGDYHKFIYKLNTNNRTETRIEDLSYDRRVEEIASMISGDKLSMYALEYAKTLLKH